MASGKKKGDDDEKWQQRNWHRQDGQQKRHETINVNEKKCKRSTAKKKSHSIETNRKKRERIETKCNGKLRQRTLQSNAERVDNFPYLNLMDMIPNCQHLHEFGTTRMAIIVAICAILHDTFSRWMNPYFEAIFLRFTDYQLEIIYLTKQLSCYL